MGVKNQIKQTNKQHSDAGEARTRNASVSS